VKVLLVSPYPYSPSSRGMDVMTACFEKEGWETDHLVFPKVFYTLPVKPLPDSTVRLLESRKARIPWVDRFMHPLPRWVFDMIRRHNAVTTSGIDLAGYDVIVLESGKPLFLLDRIPPGVTIVYRQSDSVQLVLAKNRWYRQLELDVWQRADHVIHKREIYRSMMPEELRHKAVVIENGMAVPERISDHTPFREGSINAVYTGLHALDYPTVRLLVKSFPGINFHCVGPCLSQREVSRLSHFRNFRFYRFLPPAEYMPMLKFADLAFFPFVRSEAMKWFGLTSKFLHFMYFRLPIVTWPTGIPGEFENLTVYFAADRKDFAEKTGLAAASGPVAYDIDFHRYSAAEREREYRTFIREKLLKA
jgi:hypothetical protein